jgi:diguanylate cyclase (GGDEF)-like protein
MQAPAIPEDEGTRVDTLYDLRILDTEPEERFDRLTRLAKRLLQTPIAIISLVDENREWIKSGDGINKSQVSRDISFSAHAILGEDILLVPDARLDERFRDNPLVVDEPHIRFYAGCPLRAPNGSKLGTLSLIDREPRELSEDDKTLLRDLTRMAEQDIVAVQLSTMDELTMLSNRRGFEALTKHALELSRRFQKPAALLYFNLDQFKQINDRFGRDEGDLALKTFGQFLKLTFRESDVLGRLGGDEFAVFLTNVGATELDNALERLGDAIDQYNKDAKRGYDIAFRFGKVAFDISGHADVEDLMAQADALMYLNKNAKEKT